MTNKFKLYQRKMMTAICGVAFITTLAGCGNNTVENKTQDTSTPETIENVETPTNTEEVNETSTTQTEQDTAAEAAISLMLDGANNLKESASDAANSEAVQQEFARALQNFKVLSDLVFNGGEINGVTFNELSDEGKEYARNALSSLDEILNYLVPNYQERFKEWLADTTANGLDLLSDLKDTGLEFWDEVQSRRNTR